MPPTVQLGLVVDTRVGRFLVFSAGRPGQEGVGHIALRDQVAAGPGPPS
jgi:hypothetical protein